jgi:small-conductance mechanosensitive channel
MLLIHYFRSFILEMINSYDNIITRIPNSQLTKSRISNLSRCPRSRLRQFIRIKHSDIDKLPGLLTDIKEEIISSCPKVISDGSKSFHTVISSFEADHIQVMILAHFDIPPVTAEFIRNRHDVLFAIHRTMKKHQIEFAIPPVLYANNTPMNGKDPADYSY